MQSNLPKNYPIRPPINRVVGVISCAYIRRAGQGRAREAKFKKEKEAKRKN